MLSGDQIVNEVRLGGIVISPLDAAHVGPNSVDLTLSPNLLVYERPPWWDRLWRRLTNNPWHLDMRRHNPTRSVSIPPDGYVLVPGVLYLGSTNEHTETRGFVPTIETRSSVARLGVCTHLSAGYGDDGFRGTWTLEITVVHPVRVYAGVRVCQIAYSRVDGTSRKYHGKYASQTGPQASRLHEDFAR